MLSAAGRRSKCCIAKMDRAVEPKLEHNRVGCVTAEGGTRKGQAGEADVSLELDQQAALHPDADARLARSADEHLRAVHRPQALCGLDLGAAQGALCALRWELVG